MHTEIYLKKKKIRSEVSTEMKSVTVVSERVCTRSNTHSSQSVCVLEASVVAVWRSVVHGQVHHVHVVVMRVNGRVVVVLVVIVKGGQVLQRGHVGCRREPGHDHMVVYPALGWSWRVAGVRRDEQGSLYRLGLRRCQWVWVGWVFGGWTHTWTLGVSDGLYGRADSLS